MSYCTRYIVTLVRKEVYGVIVTFNNISGNLEIVEILRKKQLAGRSPPLANGAL
jgi:hypothetical protein